MVVCCTREGGATASNGPAVTRAGYGTLQGRLYFNLRTGERVYGKMCDHQAGARRHGCTIGIGSGWFGDRLFLCGNRARVA